MREFDAHQQLAAVLTIQAQLDWLSERNKNKKLEPFYSAAMRQLITLENAILVDINPDPESDTDG